MINVYLCVVCLLFIEILDLYEWYICDLSNPGKKT